MAWRSSDASESENNVAVKNAAAKAGYQPFRRNIAVRGAKSVFQRRMVLTGLGRRLCVFASFRSSA